MTGRGRGRGSAAGGAKMKMPNLASAGKIEVKSEHNGSIASNTPRGRGSNRRGSRGTPRGGRGGVRNQDSSQNVIQTEGVFSGGFGVEKGSRRTANDVLIKEEAETLSQEKAVTSNAIVNGVLREPIDSYEQFWTIDQKEEDDEMNGIIGDSLIADLKKGKIPPIVLPRHDELQFFNLLPKHVKAELYADAGDEEEILQERELDRQRQTKSHQERVEAEEDDPDPTLTYSRKAAEVFRHLSRGANNEYTLIQLPTLLGNLASRVKTNDTAVKQEMDHTQSINHDATAGPSTLDASILSEPAVIPRGKEIGSLIVTKKGRVYFEVGGQKIDVTATTSGTTAEGVVGIEIREDGGSETSMPYGMNAAQRARLHTERGHNALYYYGDIQHHMTASVNWEQMRQNTKEHDVFMKNEDSDYVPNIYQKSHRSLEDCRQDLEALQDESQKMIGDIKNILKSKRCS